jgi:uncharacterized membrane protein YcaP (DUF421 family)
MPLHTIVGHTGNLLGVVVKSVLLYGTALLLLRVGERRTLAQLNIFDVIVAVALGAIVGRVATASDSSWAEGAVALATLIVVHRLLSWLRFLPGLQRLTDPAPRVLVLDGVPQRFQLLRSGVTPDDLAAALRERGVHDFADVHVALLEGAGKLTVVTRGAGGPLVDAVIRHATLGGDIARTGGQRSRGSTSRS